MTEACDSRPPTINELFRKYGDRLRTISADEDRAFRAITTCRTIERGGSLRHCQDCKTSYYAYHSCGNRHCPLCQHEARERWVDARVSELLPVPYFHVVFTLPSDFRDLALRNKRVVYGILMRAVWETLREVGNRRLKAELAAILLLHTWGQDVCLHPHVHGIVPGGGIDKDGRWKSTNAKYLLNLKVLKEVYRAKFLEALERAWKKGDLEFSGKCEELAKPGYFEELLRQGAKKKWVIKIKRPFASPQAVIRYLGNYTHRVAISNSRIVSADDKTVTFRWKDYADRNKQKKMTLPIETFFRRIMMHVLPKGFVKIRHQGWMAHPVKKKNLAKLRDYFGVRQRPEPEQKKHEPTCPKCGSKRIEIVEVIQPRRRARIHPRFWRRRVEQPAEKKDTS